MPDVTTLPFASSHTKIRRRRERQTLLAKQHAVYQAARERYQT